MHAMIVKGEMSRMHGMKCGLCPKKIRTGESVLYRDMPNDAYLEPLLVFHTDCMAARVATAPTGAPAGDARAQAQRIREAVLTSEDLFARPAA